MRTRRLTSVCAAVALVVALGAPAAAPAPSQRSGAGGCITDGGAGGCAGGRALRAVVGIAMSADGRHLYAVAMDSRAVVALARSRSSGSLEQLGGEAGCVSDLAGQGCSPGRNLELARAAVVSPDGRFVYLAAYNGLATFARDRRTGALTQLPGELGCIREDGAEGCATARAVQGGRNLALSADGRTLYALGLTDAVAVFRRNRASGALIQLPGASGCVRQRGLDPARCREGRALNNPRALLVAPGGRRVYVGALGEPSTSQATALAVFRPDRRGGLVQLPGRRGCLNRDGGEGCRRMRGLFGVHDVELRGRTLYLPGSDDQESGGLALLRRLPGGRLRQPAGRRGCFTIDGSEGCTRARGLAGAHTLSFSRDGRRVFVASEFNTGSIAVFRRGRRGLLRQPRGSEGCLNADGAERCAVRRALRGAHDTLLSPDGHWLYVASLFDHGVAVLDVDEGR